MLAARYGNNISPNRILRRIYKNRIPTLQYDFYKGRLSYKDLQSLFYKDLQSLFKKNFLEYVDKLGKKKMMSLDYFLKETFAIEKNKDLLKLKNVLENYGSNKNIMSQLVTKDYDNRGLINKVANVFDLRKSNIAYPINIDLLKKVHDMHVRIE